MELATGIRFDGNQWTADAVTQDGEVVSFPIVDLHKRGLPPGAISFKRRIDTDLDDWKSIDGQEYLDAYGFRGRKAADVNHQFFEVKHGRWTYIVPALALMRAIFKPVKVVLPEMFLPQALDRQCRFAMSEQGMYVLVDAPWTTKALAQRYSDWNPLFTWLMAHPSAFDMASSVHVQALHGGFGLQLPKAMAQIQFRGLKAGTTMYVSDTCITAITPKDKPNIDVLGLPETIALLGWRDSLDKAKALEAMVREIIDFQQDSTVELTDQEWALIEPLLLDAQQARRWFTLSQRELLNGVLLKLASGKPWMAISYATGNWSNASQAFRRWTKRGIFEKILVVLAETRASPQ